MIKNETLELLVDIFLPQFDGRQNGVVILGENRSDHETPFFEFILT